MSYDHRSDGHTSGHYSHRATGEQSERKQNNSSRTESGRERRYTSDTLNRLRNRLRLDKKRGWIAGVAAGFANTIGTDPAIVRAGLIITALFAPKIVIGLYLVAWVLLDSD